jgi:hypothetical protein
MGRSGLDLTCNLFPLPKFVFCHLGRGHDHFHTRARRQFHRLTRDENTPIELRFEKWHNFPPLAQGDYQTLYHIAVHGEFSQRRLWWRERRMLSRQQPTTGVRLSGGCAEAYDAVVWGPQISNGRASFYE